MKSVRNSAAFFILLFAVTLISAQGPALKSTIGLSSLPADSDSICAIPNYTGGYSASGLQVGDTAYDFTFYDTSGAAVNLGSALSNGMPVLLVAGSYTCPVFRGKIDEINQVVSQYGSQIKVIVIYELEAHPDIDVSPYFGVVNTGNANIQAGILYRQPTTYGERIDVCKDLLDSLPINADVVIDGPCNEFWATYGPAPNNAYLIDTTGIVFSKHAWFDKNPDDVFCDIDSILGNPVNCTVNANGSFSWTFTSTNPLTGTAGTTIYGLGEFKNNSGSDVNIIMKKWAVDLPSGWSSSICTDVCYPSSVDSASFLLPAGSTQVYTQYFYTAASPAPDTGRIRMRFWNQTNQQNNMFQMFFAVTDTANMTGVSSTPESLFRIYPNPATDELRYHANPLVESRFRLFDLNGRELHAIRLKELAGRIDVSGFSAGTYIYLVEQDGYAPVRGKLTIGE